MFITCRIELSDVVIFTATFCRSSPNPGPDKNQQGLSCSLRLSALCGGRQRRESDRRERGEWATDGADEVDTIIKGGKQRGKQSQEFRLSIPAPFRLEQRTNFSASFLPQ